MCSGLPSTAATGPTPPGRPTGALHLIYRAAAWITRDAPFPILSLVCGCHISLMRRPCVLRHRYATTASIFASRNVYSALNAVAGHYNSFGTKYPLPAKRADRVTKVCGGIAALG